MLRFPLLRLLAVQLLRTGGLACVLVASTLNMGEVVRAQPGPPAPALSVPSELLALEREVTANPRQAIQSLTARSEHQPAHSPDSLARLYLLGAAQMRTQQPHLLDALLGQLAQLAASGEAAAAARNVQAVGLCLRAERDLRHGSIIPADQWLAQALRPGALEEPKLLLVRLRCLSVAAAIKALRRQFVDAVRLHQDILRLGQSLPEERRSLLYTDLAYTLLQADQWEHARHASTQGLNLARQTDDALALSEAYSLEAMLHSSGHHDNAQRELEALTEALRQTRRSNLPIYESQALGNLADYHLRSKDYSRAHQLAIQALELARRAHSPELIELARINQGLALLGLRRREEGLAILDQINAAQRAGGNLEGLSEVLLEQAALLEQIGDARGALKAYRAEQALTQEVALHQQQTQVLVLQEAFEASERERNRRQLVEERQLQDQRLRQQRLQVRLWGLSVLLGLLLVPVLWLWYARTRAAQRLLRRSTEHLRRQSLTDALTGLPNRRLGQERMPGQAPASGTLYLIDLDHFKQINDRHGHAVGDEVLVEVARRLRSVLREPDVVMRWGGEEFLVLVSPGSAVEAAGMHKLAQRLLTVLSQSPIRSQAGELQVTGSVGYAGFTGLAGSSAATPAGAARLPSWDDALRLVDALMYLAKTRGRNRACGLYPLPEGMGALASRSEALARAWALGQVQVIESIGARPAALTPAVVLVLAVMAQLLAPPPVQAQPAAVPGATSAWLGPQALPSTSAASAAAAVVADSATAADAPRLHALALPQARAALILSRLSEPWLIRGAEAPRSMLASLEALSGVERPPQGIGRGLWQRGVWRAQAQIAARSGQVRAMQRALESLRQLDPRQLDPLLRADQALVLALHEDLQGRSTEAREYALAAQADYHQGCQSAVTVQACDPRSWWRSLRLLAGLDAEGGDHVLALQWAQQSLHLARGIGDVRMEAGSLLAQARAHAALREHELARRSLLQAEQVMYTAHEDERAPIRLAWLLARIELERLGGAGPLNVAASASAARQQQLLQALTLARQLGRPRQESQVLLLLGQHWLEHQQAAKALQVAWQALAVARQYRDQRLHANLLHMAGLARLALRQPEQARLHLAEAQQMWALMDAPVARARALGEHSRMLERLGDMNAALRLYHQERQLRDEIERKNREALLHQLRQRHEVQQRQAELVSLARERQMAESQLETQRLRMRVATLAGAALLLAGVLVLLLVLRMRDTNRQLRQDESLLRIQSERDALTGLANRHHVSALLGAQGRLQEFRGVILLLDVDHFKRINDNYGHAAGDAVLVEVAQRLAGALRCGDLACRWGGEEFLVLAQQLSDDETEALAQRLMHAVADTPVDLPDGGAMRTGLHVQLSVGYAAFPLPGAGLLGWERALKLVDAALYAAKAGGRGRAVGIVGLGDAPQPGGASGLLAGLERGVDPQQLAELAELRIRAFQPALSDSGGVSGGG